MTLRASIRSRLIADAALALSVATRIYPTRIAAKAPLPAVAVQVISGGTIHSHGGASGLHRATVQITTVARDSVGAGQVADEIRAAIDGATWNLAGTSVQSCLRVGVHDIEPDAGRMGYVIAQDFDVHHT